MIRSIRRALGVFLAVWLAAGGFDAEAKSYSSGGGHSYSSHSSSSHSSSSHSSSTHSSGTRSSSSSSRNSSSGSSYRSPSSGSSRSSSGTSTHSSGGGSTYSSGGGSSHTSTGSSSSQGSSGSSKSYKSSSGSSYSSGSGSSSDRHSYTSGKSYSSGSGWSFGSGSKSAGSSATSQTYRRSQPASDSATPSSFSYDTAAAHARQEEVSKANYSEYKRSKTPPVIADNPAPAASAPSYQAKPPPIIPPAGGSYRRTIYVPDRATLNTRSVRIYNNYNPYYSRPWVTYNDPYSSLFWWWLLDRSLDDRAYWAYHHRYDMDPARYDALVANDQNLEARVEQLEAQQTPRDAAYVPTGMDQDLMYSDQYVNRSYHNRPTQAGVIFFWILAVPIALAVTAFFIWLIWFKRWQTAS